MTEDVVHRTTGLRWLMFGLTVLPLPALAQQPLTWDLVYGPERLDVGGRRTVERQWLDEHTLLQKTAAGWQQLDAATGSEQPWYDVATIAAALQAAGLETAEAERVALGDWLALSPRHKFAVVATDQRLLQVQLQTGAVHELRGAPPQPELAEFSPDGQRLACISQNELWVADFTSGHLQQLTTGASQTVRNGKADWVYFEEVYDRNWKAWKWSPDGTTIAFMQFDEIGRAHV